MSKARSRGRHRRTRMLAIAPAVAAVAVGGAVAGAQPAGAADVFAQIRQCESGGNYATNTGNGFYGAYQFTQATWNSLGLSGSPANASPATQDQAARQLAARSGFGQWPVCGRGGGSSAPAASTASAASTPSYQPKTTYASHRSYSQPRYSSHPASRSYSRPHSYGSTRASHSSYTPVSSHGSSGWDHPLFTPALAHQVRGDVRAWQRAIANKGYSIAVDGRYDSRCAAVARQFQIKNGLLVDGIVGPQTWGATFNK